MSTLSDKILSYSPEQYIQFNTAYATNPINLGTGGRGTWSLNNEAPFLIPDGGPDGTGSWSFNIGGNSDSSATQFRILSGTNVVNNPEITDRDFSAGVWFKQPELPATGSIGQNSVFIIAALGHYMSITMDERTNSTRGMLLLPTEPSGNNSYTNNRYDDGLWHLLSIRCIDTGEGSLTEEFYIDGQLYSSTDRTVTPSTVSLTQLSSAFVTSVPETVENREYAHFYNAPYASIDATAIAEIYAAGATVTSVIDVNVTDTPATASATQTEPLIAATAGDHTEITTSIIASMEMPPATVSTQSFLNIVVDPATANAEMINNVFVGGGTTVAITVAEFTATAEITESLIARNPMTATAQSGNHQAYVDPNYFNLVKSKDPILYNQFDSSTYLNQGSWTVTPDVGTSVQKNIASTQNMGLVGSGLSWQHTESSTTRAKVKAFPSGGSSQIYDLIQSKDFTVEYWFKPSDLFSLGVRFAVEGVFEIGFYKTNKTMYLNLSRTLPAWNIAGDAIPNDSYDRKIIGPTNAVIANSWNHVAYRQAGNEATLFINGAVAGILNITLDTWDNANGDSFNIFQSSATTVTGSGSLGWVG